MAQIKFVVEDELAEQFKRAVLKRRGKLALSDEGAKAIQLYLDSTPAEPAAPAEDPLLKAIGIATSKGGPRPNALASKRSLYR
jgi:hypothetical protein